MAAIVADAGNAQGSHLPHVLVLDLGDRDVELILHPGGDRPENHSLALQGMVLVDAQPDPQGTDVHLINRKEPRKLTARIPVNHTTGRLSNGGEPLATCNYTYPLWSSLIKVLRLQTHLFPIEIYGDTFPWGWGCAIMRMRGRMSQ